MKRSARQATHSRGLWALLAFLALAMNVLVPPGFMVGASPAAGTGLVICTGHGPATLPGATSPKGHPAGKSGHDAGACAFAGHGVSSAPPASARVASEVFAPRVRTGAEPQDQTPGRGLAAPPPPSQGPPVQI